MSTFGQVLWTTAAVALPALFGFFVATSLSAGNYRWKYFKKRWLDSVVLGLGTPLAFYLIARIDFLEWWQLCLASAIITLVAFALGAKFNPLYKPAGKDPFGMAIEIIVIALVSALVGLAWGLLPGGNQSSGLFTILLMGFVVYIFFLYDDTPKGSWKANRGLLGTTYLIEVAAAVLAFMLWLIGAVATLVVTGLLDLFLGPTGVSKFLWQEGLPGWIYLVLWILVNWAFWLMSREPQGNAYPDHVFPTA